MEMCLQQLQHRGSLVSLRASGKISCSTVFWLICRETALFGRLIQNNVLEMMRNAATILHSYLCTIPMSLT